VRNATVSLYSTITEGAYLYILYLVLEYYIKGHSQLVGWYYSALEIKARFIAEAGNQSV
jgi:hypothetical protein